MVYLEDLIMEPFQGFSKEALAFFKKLKNAKNNNKAWFDKNRDKYEVYIKEPMRLLIRTLSDELRKVDDKIFISNKSVFRINRDIRFKKDKTPYKTHYGAAFTFEVVKRPEIPQFYFHLSSDEFLFASGQYSTDTVVMDKIKKKIFNRKDEFFGIINDKNFLKDFGGIEGDLYEKLPGKYSYAKNNRQLQPIFNMKNIYAYRTYPPETALDSELVEVIINDVKTTYNFNKFLFYT